jgi:hypothetical protein
MPAEAAVSSRLGRNEIILLNPRGSRFFGDADETMIATTISTVTTKNVVFIDVSSALANHGVAVRQGYATILA